MRLYIYDDKEAVGAWTAEYIASRINSFGATEERPFVLGLPTGVCPCVSLRELEHGLWKIVYVCWQAARLCPRTSTW